MNSKVSFSSNSIVRVLAIITVCLIIASTAAVLADDLTGRDSIILHKLVKLFYVELELNIPAFFSSLILLMASFVLAIIAYLKNKQGDKYRTEWIILAVGFLFMSFDELMSVHERMIEPMRELLKSEHLGIFYFAWVIPMGILVLLLGVLFFRFWWNLSLKTKIWFTAAAVVYLGGAVGFELIESKHCEIYGKDNLTYFILTTVEESLEMTGIVFFIWSLLKYATENFGEVKLELNDSWNEPNLQPLRNSREKPIVGVPQKPA